MHATPCLETIESWPEMLFRVTERFDLAFCNLQEGSTLGAIRPDFSVC